MSSGWGNSFYDASSNETYSSWRDTPATYSQNEQYNPDFPSLSGTTYIVPFTTQGDYSAYFPSKRSTTNRGGAHNSKRNWKSKPKPVAAAAKGEDEDIKYIATISKPKNPTTGGKAPNNSVKVARVKRNSGIRKPGGNNKMPNYSGLNGNGWAAWNGAENGDTKPPRGGRGGRGRGRGGFRRNVPRPHNSKEDIPFVPLPDGDPAISLVCSADNIVAFHGFDSVFTTQHNFPVLIDGKIYSNCDHYYQIKKVFDLTGSISEKLNQTVRDESGKTQGGSAVTGEKKGYSMIAKEVIKASGIEKEKVEEWRNTKGLKAVQTAMLAKVSQSAHLREALKETGNQILVHAYSGDSIYGTGCTVPKIKKWLEDLEKTGVKTLKVPATFPLDEETVKQCPVFAHGRNILGVILMQLRERVRHNQIEIVDMSNVFDALRVTDHSAESMDTTGSGFQIGGATTKPGTF